MIDKHPPDPELTASPNDNPNNGAQNSLQILKTYFKKHYVSILILLSLFVGFLFFLRLWPTFKWSIPTSIIIALLLIFMCVVILILGRDSQGPDFFRAASSIVLFLSLLLFLLWLLVNLVWPARYNLYRTDDLFDRDFPGTLAVRYPDTILADAKTAEFSFAWRPSTSLTTPLTITLISLSPALHTDISLPHTLFTYTVTPTVTVPLTSHLFIRNGRTMSGDILFERLQEETMVLEVSPFTSTQTKPLSEILTIRVETEWGYTMRTFVNSAVTDRSPLLLAVTGLLAVAGFMYQEHLKASTAREERERTEKEKREERERSDKKEQAVKEKEEREEQRNRCEASIKSEIRNFKQQLKGQKSDLLSHSWSELDSRVQSCNLQSFNLSEDLQKDLEIVRTLWRIVQADGTLLSLIQSVKDWPNECVAAYLLAYKEHSIGKQSELIQARQYLPKEDHISQDLLDALQRIREEEEKGHFPPRKWLSDRFTPSKITVDIPSFLSQFFKKHGLDREDNSSRIGNPFAWEYAEQDIYDLFASGGFWPGHKVVSGLETSVQPIIICGVPGSGRTTFALDLARYNLSNSQLALYLAQEPSLEDIQAGFGQLLLAFIKDHPIFLGGLRTHERKAIISLLAVSLNQVFILAELDAAFRKIEKARNLSERTDDQQNYQSNEVGNRIALSYLEQFSQEIASGSWPVNLSPAAWASLLWRSAESLGFSDQRPRLVLDAGMNSVNWWNSTIAPHVWAWHQNGVNVVLTIPISERDQLQHTSQFDTLTIDWDQLSLMDMISHRAEKLLPRRSTIEDLIEDKALDLLIENSRDESGSFTPRRWIQLWNHTIQLASSQKIITQELVQQVLTSQ